MAAVDLSHTRTVEETLELYKVTEDEGLSQESVLELRQKFGYNGMSNSTNWGPFDKSRDVVLRTVGCHSSWCICLSLCLLCGEARTCL